MPLNVTEKKRKRQETLAAEAVSKKARLSPEDRAVTSQRGQIAEQELATLSVLPTLVVLDLDDTVWCGDVDMTSGPPFTTDGRGLPVLAQKGGHGDKVVPFDHVAEIFDWLEANGIKVVVSTHSYKPQWADEIFGLLETVNGTKYRDLLAIPIGTEIQRKGKDVHLKQLATATGFSTADMVFFDDKAHNVSDGKKAGVTSCTTAEGLNWDKFVECLRSFEQKKGGTSEAAPRPQAALGAPHPLAAFAAGAGGPRPWRPPSPGLGGLWNPGLNPQMAAAGGLAGLAAQLSLLQGLRPPGRPW